MRILALSLAVLLPSCGGIDLPDSDGDGIPDLIDPCPQDPDPTCTPDTPGGEAYDCLNPPALSGLVKVENPIPGQYLIKLKPPQGMALSAVAADIPALAAAEVFPNVQALAAVLDIRSLAAVLKDSRVEYVQEVGEKHALIEWNLDRIDDRSGLDGSYQPKGDGAGVRVGIGDTGIWPHDDFKDRLAEECFTAHIFGGCVDQHGHGTHVSGSVAGTIFGVASKATLISIRMLNEKGSGTDTDVIGGIDWAIANNIDVINMSLGGSAAPALDAAVCRAWEAGILSVVASGNDSKDARGSSPARVMQALTVNAMEKGDSTAYFSNRGPVTDLYAPGAGVKSAALGGGSSIKDGTSMASPHVAGAAALYLSDHPGASPSEIHDALVAASTEGALSNVPSETPNLLLYVGKEE